MQPQSLVAEMNEVIYMALCKLSDDWYFAAVDGQVFDHLPDIVLLCVGNT